jgi:hypothetical protein
MPTQQIQYSEKYYDDVYEYRYDMPMIPFLPCDGLHTALIRILRLNFPPAASSVLILSLTFAYLIPHFLAVCVWVHLHATSSVIIIPARIEIQPKKTPAIATFRP